jgi:hypothetical protein
MRIHHALSLVLGLADYAAAATSFAGSNLYYAAGLTRSQQTTLFTGLKDAGVQVLRVWLDGKFISISPFVTVTLWHRRDTIVLTNHRSDISPERHLDKQLPQSRG